MKRFLSVIWITALCAVTISSCKKSSSSTSSYYVKFNVNDSLVTWNYVVGEIGTDLQDSTKTDFGMNAVSKDTSTAIILSIQVNGKSLPTGTYESTNSSLVVFADFYTGYNSPAFVDYTIDDASGMAPSTFTITISAITSKDMRGTFTGNYLYDFLSGKTVAVTNGEFFVPRLP
ncbi:MAG TPA: hypothetical protein VKR32_04055 [Puia sp.]|nr:hypothetical protein [Puia sp.]